MGEDFIVWDLPLKELTLLGIDYTKSGYLDLSGDDNTIYKIYADDGLKIKTPGYTIKQDSGYSLDLTEFLYNPKPEDEWTFSFPSISGYPFEVEGYKLIFEDKVPETVTIKIRFPGSSDPEQFYTYNILTRGGTLTYNIYSDNYADLKENKYIKDNCEANDTGKYFTCTSDVYSGDSIDTDAFVKELGLTDYAVSKIGTVKSTSATFTTNEDTVKKGTVGPDAEIELKLQLDTDASDGPAVPDTGIFTTSGTTIVATTAAATITLAGTAFYLSRHATKRQKSKVRFGKK